MNAGISFTLFAALASSGIARGATLTHDTVACTKADDATLPPSIVGRIADTKASTCRTLKKGTTVEADDRCVAENAPGVVCANVAGQRIYVLDPLDRLLSSLTHAQSRDDTLMRDAARAIKAARTLPEGRAYLKCATNARGTVHVLNKEQERKIVYQIAEKCEASWTKLAAKNETFAYQVRDAFDSLYVRRPKNSTP